LSGLLSPEPKYRQRDDEDLDHDIVSANSRHRTLTVTATPERRSAQRRAMVSLSLRATSLVWSCRPPCQAALHVQSPVTLASASGAIWIWTVCASGRT
jgi:hypothetical protein